MTKEGTRGQLRGGQEHGEIPRPRNLSGLGMTKEETREQVKEDKLPACRARRRLAAASPSRGGQDARLPRQAGSLTSDTSRHARLSRGSCQRLRAEIMCKPCLR